MYTAHRSALSRLTADATPTSTGVKPGNLVRLGLARALEGPQSLLTGLSCLALPLHRRLLVVLAPLHLLIEAILEHLFFELLEGGLDLVVEHHDLHSGHPLMPGGAVMPVRNRVVHPVHLRESLRPVLDGTADGTERLARLLDDLARVVIDAPPPASTILRRRHRGDLHRATTDSGARLHCRGNLCFELRKLFGARGRNSSVRCLAPSRSGPSTGLDEFPLFP